MAIFWNLRVLGEALLQIIKNTEDLFTETEVDMGREFGSNISSLFKNPTTPVEQTGLNDV